ncbi:hypothetical protein K2173_018886 [Erythroxylum novogranatense]|uniref:Uncharacterized protein n=1 Tax=Erythroxylum novogranatense TaxID=1862640 RepID=A0AAV8SB75_9ROSI|nr:hypothetical protein K2173_018886 [Erythroxylum novogranatense]
MRSDIPTLTRKKKEIFYLIYFDPSKCRFKENRWDSRMMLGSGGMPRHIQRIVTLAIAIGLEEGAGEAPTFLLLWFWHVIYDASGVRLHAGRQAELLNQIVCELPPEHPVSNIRPLRDSLANTSVCVIFFLMYL